MSPGPKNRKILDGHKATMLHYQLSNVKQWYISCNSTTCWYATRSHRARVVYHQGVELQADIPLCTFDNDFILYFTDIPLYRVVYQVFNWYTTVASGISVVHLIYHSVQWYIICNTISLLQSNCPLQPKYSINIYVHRYTSISYSNVFRWFLAFSTYFWFCITHIFS